jgi:methylaspartate mutase sigma subunit
MAKAIGLKTVVLGVLGVDAHVVGNKIMAHALESGGFKVVNIGTFSSQQDFIRAAIETAADAILVGSLCGHGEMECRGFRENCIEAGIGEVHLVVGGNLVVGKQKWEEALPPNGLQPRLSPWSFPQTGHRGFEERPGKLKRRTEQRA